MGTGERSPLCCQWTRFAYDHPHLCCASTKWYDDKIAELAPVHNAYLTSDAASAKSFIEASHVVWAGIADALMLLEGSVRLPYALGDQVSLADLHVGAWLARILAVAKAVEPSAQDELAALNKALQHPNLQDSASAAKGVGEKVCHDWLCSESSTNDGNAEADTRLLLPLHRSQRTGHPSNSASPSRKSTQTGRIDGPKS